MPLIGVSTIYAYPRSFLKTIKDAVEMGFRHINIFAFPPHFREDDEEFVRKAKKILFDFGVECSLKVQGYTINIAATNPNLRRKSMEEAEYWINIAGKLGCSSVVLRAGMFFYSERVFKEQSYRNLTANLRKLIELADRLGLETYIENYPYPFDVVILPSDLIRLSRLMKMRLNLTLNIPHLYDVYKSRRVHLERELDSSKHLIKMIYIGHYMNPWDYPHRLDDETFERYLEFYRNVLFSLKNRVGAIVLIGYSHEDLDELKNELRGLLL